jgi:hypothetical protein
MMMTGSGGLGGRGLGSGGAMSSGGAGGMGGATSTGGSTPSGGVMGPGTGGSVPTGGAGGSGSGGAGGRGGSGSGGMAGNGGRSGATGGSAGVAGPSCFTDDSLPCTCPDYCRMLDANCASSMFYPANECVLTCQGFNWQEAPINATSNGLSCRSNNLARAISAPALCKSAGPTGYSNCGIDRCAVLCSVIARNCPDARYPYQSDDDCMGKCSAYAFDTKEDVLRMSTIDGGNNGNCRLFWASYAGRPSLTDMERNDACAKTAMMSMACP